MQLGAFLAAANIGKLLMKRSLHSPNPTAMQLDFMTKRVTEKRRY